MAERLEFFRLGIPLIVWQFQGCFRRLANESIRRGDDLSLPI